MFKKTLSIIILSILILGLAACGSTSTSNTQSQSSGNENTSNDSDTTYHIRVGHVLAPDSPYQVIVDKWKELVEERSEGRITVESFPSGQLGNEKALVDGLRYNTLEATVSGAAISSIEPKFFVVDLPFVFESKEDERNKVSGELGEKLFDLLPQYGIKGLAWGANGFRHVTNSVRPIHTPDDFKGLKIRVPGHTIYVETLEALGATPATIDFTELYTALEQGVVDGQENPLPLIYTSKFHELQNHLTLTNHIWGPGYLLMSLDFYESLPEDLQKIVSDAAIEARDYQWAHIDESEEKIIAELEAAGVNVVKEIDVELFREKTKSVYDKYRDMIGEELMDLATK